MIFFLFIVGLCMINIDARSVDQIDQNIQSANQTGAQRFRRWANHCSWGRHYCGSELSSMGYNNMIADNLYMCGNNGQTHRKTFCAQGCHYNDESPSQCHCRIGATYCGHELQPMNFVFSPINENTVYRCINQHDVSVVQQCSSRCQTNNNGQAQCPSSGLPRCTVGGFYCGHQLNSMRFQQNALYECDYNGQYQHYSTCDDGCIANNGRGSHCKPPPKCHQEIVDGQLQTICQMSAPFVAPGQ